VGGNGWWPLPAGCSVSERGLDAVALRTAHGGAKSLL
jgi:hypothetical protein